MNIVQHPSTTLRAYGPGWNGLNDLKAAPSWQIRSLQPILFTGIFDFFLPTLEVVTGIRQVEMLGNWDNPGGVWGEILDELRKDWKLGARVADDITHGDYTGVVVVTLRACVDVVIDNPSYVVKWLKEQGLSFLETLATSAVVPLRIFKVVTTGYELVAAVLDFRSSSWLVTFNLSAGDTTKPAAITTLSAPRATASSVTLNWTAPGDDGNSGTASQYDVRYSTSIINGSNWGSTSQASGEPTPQSAGSSETFTVTGLNANTTYYFAVKTADEIPNWSGLSNVVGAATTALGGDVYEPDNGPASAKLISIGQTQERSIDPLGDEDWVKFTLTSASTVTFTVDPRGSDVTVLLFDSDGTTKLMEWVVWPGPENLTYTNLPAGTRYLYIINSSSLVVGSYTVAFSVGGP